MTDRGSDSPAGGRNCFQLAAAASATAGRHRESPTYALHGWLAHNEITNKLNRKRKEKVIYDNDIMMPISIDR
jgi:hypothetical protein